MKNKASVKHPGQTKHERAILDMIGCGDFRIPSANHSALESLLKKGLIVKTEKTIGRDVFGPITVFEYHMPIPVHIQWCEAVSTLPEYQDGKDM